MLKPLVGVSNDGPSDACIIRPILSSNRGVIVANGINPKYSDIDTYWMTASAIDESLRNVVCVGGDIQRTAILDNFSWGNPDKPDRLGSLVRSVKACYDIALAYGVPFISGKDSLNNEYKTADGDSISIPPTLLISAICVMPDIRKAVSMDVKSPNDLIYIVGKTHDELGGSHYYYINGYIGNNVPKVDPHQGKNIMIKLAKAIELGLVRACHDCSEGGIAVASAEMAFAGGYGMELYLRDVPRSSDVLRNDTILFSESNTRFLVEVPEKLRRNFENVMNGVPFSLIGRVTDDDKFVVFGTNGQVVISANISELKESWQKTLRW